MSLKTVAQKLGLLSCATCEDHERRLRALEAKVKADFDPRNPLSPEELEEFIKLKSRFETAARLVN